MTVPAHWWLCDKSTFYILLLLLFIWYCIPLRDIRYEAYVKGNVSVCLLSLSVCMCTPFDVLVHTHTPTLTLRLWLVQASATSVHHHRYGLRLDIRSGGAQDILSTLSCLLIMISCDGYPTSYRRHEPRTHHLIHALTHLHRTRKVKKTCK